MRNIFASFHFPFVDSGSTKPPKKTMWVSLSCSVLVNQHQSLAGSLSSPLTMGSHQTWTVRASFAQVRQ